MADILSQDEKRALQRGIEADIAAYNNLKRLTSRRRWAVVGEIVAGLFLAAFIWAMFAIL